MGSLAWGTSPSGEHMTTPGVGQTAPPFTTKDNKGKTHSLQAHKGRWVVLYFYPKDDTSGCTIEAKGFQAKAKAFAAANTVVLGVSADDTKCHNDFAAKYGLEFPLLLDEQQSIIKAYGAHREGQNPKRITYLIDPAGKIAEVLADITPQEHVDRSLVRVTSK